MSELRDFLFHWWDEHGRHDIPWKQVNASGQPDPYGIWIAEVMLQQTQFQVALPYWQRWMEVFPTVDALAIADEQHVLLLWQGLGYYSRARRLHRAAQQLQGLPWPQDLEAWLALPGIARSTAGSILSSAFDLPYAILDGNVKRVLARMTAFEYSPTRNSAHFWSLSEQLLDRVRPRDFNQALMDLGATVCTPRLPDCPCCPWKQHCTGYASGSPERFPVQDLTKTPPLQVIGVGVILNERGEVLIDQRPNEGQLGGLWEFPGGKQEYGEAIENTVIRELREELNIEVKVQQLLLSFNHSYSHRKLAFEVYLCSLIKGIPRPLASQQVKWVPLQELSCYPFPAANKKIIDALFNYYKPE